MKKRLIFGSVGGCIALASSSGHAVTTYDPFDMKAILAKAEDKALDAGKSILADLGKGVFGAIANSYAPGLGTMLGIFPKDNTGTQQILDAIAADGNVTRALLSDFWIWAITVENLSLQSTYDAVESGIWDWNNTDPRSRLTSGNRAQLGELVSDCRDVLSGYKAGASPLDRVQNLHQYATLLNLTITLAAELAELNYIGGLWEIGGGGNLDAWWASRTAPERDAIAAEVKQKRRASVIGLLSSGLGISFENYLAGMDAGGDFVAARDQQFSSLKNTSCAEGLCGPNVWTYYVGNDPQGNCRQQTKYCKAFTIRQGSFSSNCSGLTYFVDFANDYCFADANAAYNAHKALVFKDMVLRGYGPVRAFADKWWDTWGLGWRTRIDLDDTIDAYVDAAAGGAGALGSYTMLDLVQTVNGLTADERGYLRGFALAWGIPAANSIALAAYNNPDWLEAPNLVRIFRYDYNFSKFTSSTHLNAMRSWPLSDSELNAIYKAIPASKFASLQAPLL